MTQNPSTADFTRCTGKHLLTLTDEPAVPRCNLCDRPESDSGDGGEKEVAEVEDDGLEGEEVEGEEVPRLQRRLLHVNGK